MGEYTPTRGTVLQRLVKQFLTPLKLSMSMGKAPMRSVSLPKLERKVQEGLALSHGEMKIMRKATALAVAKPSPNSINNAQGERVAKERAIAGTDRRDAALGSGTTTGTDKMLAFVYDRVENTGFGGHSSAGQVYAQTPYGLAGLKAAPRLEASLDCRHPSLIALQADKEANFGRARPNWTSNGDVGSCINPVEPDKAAAKQRIRELKRRLKEEKHARRALERSASEAGVPLPRGDGPRSWLDPPGAPPLPEGWFETCDALGGRVWCHLKTKHSVRLRPTDETPVEPPGRMGLEATGQGLPKNWFETRDAGEKHHGETIWRNYKTMEVSRYRPADGETGVAADGGSSPNSRSPNGVSSVYVPGRDAPKANRAEMVGREIQMRRAREMHAQSIHAQSQQAVQAAVSPTRRHVATS